MTVTLEGNTLLIKLIVNEHCLGACGFSYIISAGKSKALWLLHHFYGTYVAFRHIQILVVLRIPASRILPLFMETVLYRIHHLLLVLASSFIAICIMAIFWHFPKSGVIATVLVVSIQLYWLSSIITTRWTEPAP